VHTRSAKGRNIKDKTEVNKGAKKKSKEKRKEIRKKNRGTQGRMKQMEVKIGKQNEKVTDR